MGLGDLARKVIAAGAPVLGGLLGGPAGGVVTKIIAGRLGTRDDADEIAAAIDRDPDAAVRLREIQAEHGVSLERIELEREANRIAAETVRFAEAARTIREELASKDGYVRRARPSLVYSAVFTMAALKVLAFYVFVSRPGHVADLVSFVQVMVPLVMLELAAAGYYIGRRSRDKSVAAGHDPGPGLFGALAGRLAR